MNKIICFGALRVSVYILQCAAVSLHSRMCTCILIYLDIHGGPSSNLVYSPHQMTPLHWATGEDHGGAVEYLIQAGADINIEDDDGVSE